MTGMQNKEIKQIKYGVAGEMMRSFVLQILVYAVVLVIVWGLGYVICHSRIWYGNEPLYPILQLVKEEWLICFLMALLLGCMMITGLHFFRFAHILERMTEAVSDMAGQRVTYVTLPAQLHRVQDELNQILSRMQQERQAAREAEQHKNDMIVYMAHDLKTPLTSVIGYLQLLQDEREISSELREKYLGVALHKAQRLEDLCNEFFEMTKYNFSHMVLTMTKVNLSVMLEQLLFEFTPLFREKGLVYQASIQPEIFVHCDVDKMERMFDNLLKNAVNYCYENTTIEVWLQWQQSGVWFQLRNAGATIPKEKREHLFEQFFRMDSSRSSSTGGSGLGLAIAKEIVQLHHGTITCDSKDEMITFTVQLPGGVL